MQNYSVAIYLSLGWLWIYRHGAFDNTEKGESE